MGKMMDTYLIKKSFTSKGQRRYLYLIIYDIIDNRRRNRLFKLLKSYGTPVQKSCFETYLTSKQFHILENRIKRVIDENKDNVRIYKLNELNKVYNYGIENNNAYTEVLIF